MPDDRLTLEDRAKLEAIAEAMIPGAPNLPSLIFDYYADTERVERTPAWAICMHMGLMMGRLDTALAGSSK